MSEPQKNPAILALIGQKKPEPVSQPQEPVLRPEAVYFDTNPLIGAGWPNPSAQLLQILEQADKLSFPLCLPEGVKQELEGHWIRELREEWRNVNLGVDRLNKKAQSVAMFNKLPALPSPDNLRKAVGALVSDFTQRFKVAPVTERPLSEFLKLAIYRGATFDDGGRGFQDAVILCSVLDDMKAMGFATAALVTNDKAFQNKGVAELSRTAGVTLKIVPTLDELEKLLRSYFSAIVREHIEQERKQLMDALNTRLQDIQKYLVEHLTVTPSELGVWGTVRKVESLQVLDIENAHEGFFWPHEQPAEPNRVRVSADVRIRLNLDIEGYSLADPVRLKVGGGGAPTPDSVLNPFAFVAEMNAKSHEAVAVVEAEVTKGDTGYFDLRFTGTYLKRGDWGFGRYGSLLAGLK